MRFKNFPQSKVINKLREMILNISYENMVDIGEEEVEHALKEITNNKALKNTEYLQKCLNKPVWTIEKLLTLFAGKNHRPIMLRCSCSIFCLEL